jgi:hypothetical protein
MKKLALLCTAIFLAGLAVGCKSKEAQLVGKWNGPDGMSLNLAQDKTFTQEGKIKATGTWALSASVVSLKVSTVMGQPKDKVEAMLAKALPPEQFAAAKKQLDGTTDLTLSDDGKSLTQSLPNATAAKSPKGTTQMSVTLTKDDSKS